jgi:hypothetical protein
MVDGAVEVEDETVGVADADAAAAAADAAVAAVRTGVEVDVDVDVDDVGVGVEGKAAVENAGVAEVLLIIIADEGNGIGAGRTMGGTIAVAPRES